MCASASHQPQSSSHSTLPMTDAAPAEGSRTTVEPNGHSVCAAIRSAAIPNGIVMMKMKQTIAAST